MDVALGRGRDVSDYSLPYNAADQLIERRSAEARSGDDGATARRRGLTTRREPVAGATQGGHPQQSFFTFALGERLYATHDQWHVTGVLSASGTAVERYAYKAWYGSAFGKSDTRKCRLMFDGQHIVFGRGEPCNFQL